MLETQSNPSANRTQINLVGLPEEVEKAVFAGIRSAAELIDLTQHSGTQARLGALDVVPFMPVRDLSLEDCVHHARRLAHSIAQSLQLPVYLYGAAAVRLERQHLHNLLHPHFQYEHLERHISTDPHWMPDYGPALLGRAGAVLIGVHWPPVELRVVLSTAHYEVLSTIAEAISEAGGWHEVVALVGQEEGRGLLQVTLKDYQRVPIGRLLEAIRREAARFGVQIEQTQVQGIVPQAVLLDSAAWYMQMPAIDPANLLETRIAQAQADQLPLAHEEPPVPLDATQHLTLPEPHQVSGLEDFADALAAATVTPGGGGCRCANGAPWRQHSRRWSPGSRRTSAATKKCAPICWLSALPCCPCAKSSYKPLTGTWRLLRACWPPCGCPANPRSAKGNSGRHAGRHRCSTGNCALCLREPASAWASRRVGES
ncbi:MAG: hypothetical protein HC915_15955 [Anaerolineae bacterium]|nr:hypothetical protein [Anaerolineae bacterium]